MMVMDGLGTWQNRISFVNMEAGTYRIRIKAEAYGESSDVKELTVKVHPVWYLSPLAVMVYCVLFLFICYMVFCKSKSTSKPNGFLKSIARKRN